MIIPVILSGGSGSRLWPVSREMYPQQLLPLVSNATMLQETILRLKGICNIANPVGTVLPGCCMSYTWLRNAENKVWHQVADYDTFRTYLHRQSGN